MSDINEEIKEILDNFKNHYDELGLCYYPEDILGPKDLKLLYDYITNLKQENNRLNNIIDEIKNMCKEEYYKKNTTDIDSIGLSNNIWVMIYMKINELKGDNK